VEKILLPIDLSHPEKAEEILQEAKKVREGREASFTVVHVVTPLPGFVSAEFPEDFAKRALNDAKNELEALVRGHGLESSTEILVRSGHPQHEIVALAKEKAIDLIIIASHKPEIADYLLGSVAAAVVRHAPCSVLVKR
jgi:nucleotide-binding universal stress UspA family protein